MRSGVRSERMLAVRFTGIGRGQPWRIDPRRNRAGSNALPDCGAGPWKLFEANLLTHLGYLGYERHVGRRQRPDKSPPDYG